MKYTLPQKIGLSLLTAGSIGMLFALFSRRFIPSDIVNLIAITASLLGTALSFLFYIQMRKKGLMDILPESWPLLQKIFFTPIIPVFIFGFFWINFAIAIPQTLNNILGKERVITDHAIKDYFSYARECKHQIVFSTLNNFFLNYCVDERTFNCLSDKSFEVKVKMKSSVFGSYVDNVELNP